MMSAVDPWHIEKEYKRPSCDRSARLRLRSPVVEIVRRDETGIEESCQICLNVHRVLTSETNKTR